MYPEEMDKIVHGLTKDVIIYTSVMTSSFDLQHSCAYIMLTEIDRIRLKKFYSKLPENFEIININGLLPSAFYATPRSIMVTDYRREK